jgi:hypothetical protein
MEEIIKHLGIGHRFPKAKKGVASLQQHPSQTLSLSLSLQKTKRFLQQQNNKTKKKEERIKRFLMTKSHPVTGAAMTEPAGEDRNGLSAFVERMGTAKEDKIFVVRKTHTHTHKTHTHKTHTWLSANIKEKHSRGIELTTKDTLQNTHTLYNKTHI